MSEAVKEIKRLGNTVVVCAWGEVTIQESPEFHRRLLDVCREAPRRLIVNLSEVSYIDSSGVGTLVDINRKMGRHKGELFLVGLTPTVRSVFEITKLDQFFSIYDNEQEALAK